MIVHDDIYEQTERDPWIFYECGKRGDLVVTGDKLFMKSFPHMAAIALGNTTVFAFSNVNYNSHVRGKAFIDARAKILRAIRNSRGERFIASIGTNASLTILERSSIPQRKYCDEKDWRSYERVCAVEGVSCERLSTHAEKAANT